MSLTYESTNDYEINFQDYLTGEYISLGSGGYCSVKFDGVGSPDLREAVYDLSGGDGVQFGIEYYGAINWTISGAIHSGVNSGTRGTAEDAWNAWSMLSRAWTMYPQRTRPREVVPLYFKRPGREQMVVFGRPNRIDPETSRSHAGFISYSATFRQSDPKFYSSSQQSITLDLETPYSGGLLMNATQNALKVPFQTTAGVPRTGFISATGDTDTSPVIVINGPVTSPQVSLYDELSLKRWTVYIPSSIPSGRSVTIDTRNWARSIVDNTGASWAGSYVGSKLQDVTIPPGTNMIEYLGTDVTGTSTCQVLFRNAWASL